MKRRKIVLLVGLCMILLLSLMACAKKNTQEEYKLQEENKLVIYTSHKEEIYGPIIREFEERTGIWVDVVTGGTNEMLERIEEEKGQNSGDVMFGGGVDSLDAYAEYFQTYACSQLDDLDNTYVSTQNKYTVFSKLPLVIIYNKKLVYQVGVPKTWEEMLNSRWKGKIAFADPEKSGSSYTALLTLMQIMSDEMSEEEVLTQFIKNLDGDLCESSGEVLEEVISGKKMIGISLEETTLKETAKNADIGMIYPVEGTTALPDGCAIIRNAPHRENAEKFLEFTVSEDVQRLLEERLFRRSVRTKDQKQVPYREIVYDLSYSEKNRNTILSQWSSLIR